MSTISKKYVGKKLKLAWYILLSNRDTKNGDLMIRKVYVEVTARFDTEGNITPLSVTWEDGTVYTIDKVVDKRRAASLKAGGIGMRYTCRIVNQESYLFYEEPRWFVEAKS